MMSTLTLAYKQISEIAELLHKNGWAEKNAGNFSVMVNMDNDIISHTSFPLNIKYPELSEKILIVTGKGKRMRDIARNPAENTAVIKLNKGR